MTKARDAPRDRLLIILGIIGLIVVSVVMIITTDPDPSADAFQDWMVVSAAFDGLDPTTPGRVLGEKYGLDVWNPVPHPRAPSAFPILAPLALTTPHGAWLVTVIVSSASAGLILWRLWGARGLAVAPIAPLTIEAGFASHAAVVAALIVLGVGVSNDKWGGFLLGLAVALKLWPAIVLLALWNRRAIYAWAWFGAWTLVGLLIVDPFDVVAAMSKASRLFVRSPTNGSLAGGFVQLGLPYVWAVGAGFAAGFVWWLRHRTVEAAIAAGLLMSPLVWAPYYWAAAPLIQPDRPWAIGAAVLWLSPIHGAWIYLGVGLLLAVSVERSSRTQKSRSPRGRASG